MHFSQALSAVAVMSTLAVAAPTEALTGFTVEQVEVGKKFKSGSVEMSKTFQKYNKPVPAHVAAAAAAALQSGSVTATPEQYDSSYLAPVNIGSPAQQLMLDFDTGSADLWAFSSYQPSSQSSGHSIYTPSKSTTAAQENGETWDISYGDGSGAKGIVFADKVVIGPVTATSQAVEAATSVSSQFQQDTDNDGLVGLAFSSINTASPRQVTTFFDTVKSTLPSPLFWAYLKHNAAGSYGFGYIDSSKYTGSIYYSPVDTSNGFWQFTVTGYSVGTGGETTSSLSSIADTGTTLVYMPQAVLTAYYNKVSNSQNNQNAGGYIFPCSDTLPTLSFYSGGGKHTIPGSYLNYAPYTSNYCFGGLQSSAGIGFNILGDVFLKSQYVIFDAGNTRIGIATQN